MLGRATAAGDMSDSQIAQMAIEHGVVATARALKIPKSTITDIKRRYQISRGETDTLSEHELLERENTLLRGQLSTRSRQQSGILRSIYNVFANTPIEIVVPPAQPRIERHADRPTHLPVLVLSDTQIGKNSGGYDTGVASQRIANFATKALRVLEVMRAGANVPAVEIWLGGDMVEGEAIYPNQPYEIECGVGEQACIYAPVIMTQFILAFASAGYNVAVRSIKGNHGRVSSRSNPTSESANWDLVSYHVTMNMAYKVAQRRGIEERITWPDGIPDHWYNVVRMPGGWGVMFTHGDMISGGGTSASFERKVSGWLQAIPEPFDYVVMGHFHRGIEWPVGNIEVIVNGTTETPESQFLQGVMAATNRSFQRMLVFHEEHGLIDNKKFYLDDHKPRIR